MATKARPKGDGDDLSHFLEGVTDDEVSEPADADLANSRSQNVG